MAPHAFFDGHTKVPNPREPTREIAPRHAIAPRPRLFPAGKFGESNRKNDSPIAWPLLAAHRHGAAG